MKLNPRAGPSRGTWSSWYLQKTESPTQSAGRRRSPRFARIASFDLFLHPLVRELEDLQLRRVENTASRAGVNGTEVVQSGTNVPYSTDDRLKIEDWEIEIRRQGSRINTATATEGPLLFEKARGYPHGWTSGEQHRFSFFAPEAWAQAAGAERRSDGLRDRGKNAK